MKTTRSDCIRRLQTMSIAFAKKREYRRKNGHPRSTVRDAISDERRRQQELRREITEESEEHSSELERDNGEKDEGYHGAYL